MARTECRTGAIPRCQWRRARGLSLVEVLMVVGMIALLVGILAPGLSKARRTASVVACQSNLRQWSFAATVYSQDNEGFLPRRGQGVQATTVINRSEDWFNALPPLLGQPRYDVLAGRGQVARPGAKGVWMCPAAVEARGPNYFAYGMNMLLSTWLTPRPDRIDRVAPTDRQVLLADGPGPYCSTLPAAQPYTATARHDGRINITFLDGHAGGFDGAYVGCGVGDPRREDVQWIVPGAWSGPIP